MSQTKKLNKKQQLALYHLSKAQEDFDTALKHEVYAESSRERIKKASACLSGALTEASRLHVIS